MSDFQLAEDFLPVYDVSDAVAATAEAEPEVAWQALLEVDLLHEGGWILLGERPEREIALGLVGKFWRPVIEW